MRYVATILGVAAVGVAGALFSLPQDREFPHERHAGLFPTCEGCHAGILTEEEAPAVSVTPAECANCHDGERLVAVEWSAPDLEPSNLDFSHAVHVPVFEMFDRDASECVDCHKDPDADTRMAVVRAQPAACFECHDGEAEEHYAGEIDCATCHLPLAEADALSATRIADFPMPPSHTAEGFPFAHGEQARAEDAACAICHTRDSCERCHLNAPDVTAIAALTGDERVASLVAGRPGEWPEPESHLAEEWVRTHPIAAREEIAECANCHAQSSCAACHGAGQPRIATELPEAPATGPTGVVIAAGAAMPVGHDETFFDRHGTAAAVGMPDCSTCHTERFCVDCHDADRSPSFHPVDFVARHAADAYANAQECAACHSREGFCRDCHAGVGLRVAGRTTGGAFHDAQSDWLLAHGQAARQNLESCTTCHEQSSCLRCHSAKAGLRINPHGDDFDAARVADRSTQSCAICHFALPGGIEP